MDQSAGIFITQVGASVQTAADYQFVFNSNWPSLSIAYETTVSVPYTPNNNTLVIPHNLNFFPFAQVWLTVNGRFIFSFYSIPSSFGGGGSFTNTSYSVDTTNIYPVWQFNTQGNPVDFFGNATDGSLTAQVHIRCYNLDISQYVNYTAPRPAVVKTPYDHSVGIKIVKSNKDIRSTDLRDYILHSRAQSPAILSVLTQEQGTPDPNLSGNTLISYTNPAGYTAWFFGFQKANFNTPENPDYRYESIPVQPSGYTSVGASVASQNTFILSVPTDPGGSMVVLRDPLFAASNIQVSY